MDQRLKQLHPHLTPIERKIVIRKLKEHSAKGGKIGRGFLNNLVSKVKSLGSKVVEGVKAVAKDIGSKAVEKGLEKLQEATNQHCTNPKKEWLYKPKSGEKHAVILKDGCSYRSRFAGPGTHLLENTKELLAMHGGNISQSVAAMNFPSPDVDRASFAHDIRYQLSNGDAKKVREADIKFVKVLENSKDLVNKLAPLAGIKAKMLGEDRGLPVYSGSEKISEEDKKLLEKILTHLEHLGYGKKGRKGGLRSAELHEGGCIQPESKARIAEDISYAQHFNGKGKGKKKTKKRPSNWIQHVKQYAAEHGISYKEALSKAKASYKK